MGKNIFPLTSSSIQARHGYIASDIVFDGMFANCVFRSGANKGTGAVIDFAHFHTIIPVESNVEACEVTSHGG